VTTRSLLLHAWDPSLAVWSLCLVALLVHATYFRARHSRHSVYFVAAVGVFFLALASPIGVLARGYLFSAHMLQHLLLLLAVPPLVLLGLPRQAIASTGRVGRESGRGAGAVSYALPWSAGIGAMWLWHERTLCNAAGSSPSVQWFQTASLLAMGLLFWRPILAPRMEHRFRPFPAILYLFSACIACTVLGILVTFSPVAVCSVYAHPVDELGALPLLRDGWGMSSSVDQQLGGLMMWLPACLVYAAAILATLARYYREGGDASSALGAQRATASEFE
jgi:putative membrane protein